MKGAKDSSTNYLRYLFIVFAAVFVIATALLIMGLWERNQGFFPEREDVNTKPVIVYNDREFVLRDDVTTVLVMGLDKYETTGTQADYNNNQQADFLMLLVIDEANERCSAIHINRDTMTPVHVLGVAGQKIDTQTMQIALAHAYGNGQEVSCNNTADAVSELLFGVPIDHYVSLTMSAVAKINDLVGGVEVTLLEDFSDIDAAMVKGETITLKGDQALTYVRTRYGREDSSNATRMQRQRQYLTALFDKARQAYQADDQFYADASRELADAMVTSDSASHMQKLLNGIFSYGPIEIREIEGRSEQGKDYMEFYPSEQSLKKEVAQLLSKPKDK